MARKPARSKARRSAPRTEPSPSTPREKIIEAFMALLAEKSIETIGLAEIAERADVSLADLRGEFASPLAILAAHVASNCLRRTRRPCARCCARRGAIRRSRLRSTP